MKEQEDGVVIGVGCPLVEQLLPLISTEKVHAVAKSTPWQSPRRGKVHAVAKSTPWQSPRCPKSKFLAVERGKVLPRCPKSTLSKVRSLSKKKKSKFCGNLTRSGVRVRGLGLVWTSALTRSDRDQHQTRSRTRHRNLTRLVSHVLLTSLMKKKVPDEWQARQAIPAILQVCSSKCVCVCVCVCVFARVSEQSSLLCHIDGSGKWEETDCVCVRPCLCVIISSY